MNIGADEAAPMPILHGTAFVTISSNNLSRVFNHFGRLPRLRLGSGMALQTAAIRG